MELLLYVVAWILVGYIGMLLALKVLAHGHVTHPINPFVMFYLSLFGPLWILVVVYELSKDLSK